MSEVENFDRLIIFEDDHLLVINKPAGMNTHAPSPFACEGIYEWLKNREPKWARLAIIHRLDKETSGVMVFGKSGVANRSLTDQFAKRLAKKTYLLLTDRKVGFTTLNVKSEMVRAGEKYMSRAGGDFAETNFLLVEDTLKGGLRTVRAEPLTGRTHQIRVHASEKGFPILGDTLYGGAAAARVYLHAAELRLKHPATGVFMTFSAPVDFAVDPRLAMRAALMDVTETDAYRLVHGATDGWPGFYVDRLGDFLLAQSAQGLNPKQREFLAGLTLERRALLGVNETEGAGRAMLGAPRGVYHKVLKRQVQQGSPEQNSPQWVLDEKVPEEIVVTENGVKFALKFSEGYSVGLFLDQRDNRRRLLTGYIAPEFGLPEKCEVLNAFAYTCGFSVAAAKGGARVTSLDLSTKYLDWGKKNFQLNGIDPGGHEFIFGDVFEWLRRLEKKGKKYDVILLDPPTFSRSKEHGIFQAEKDYGALVAAALPLLKPNGILFSSTNAATLKPEKFLEMIGVAVKQAGRRIMQQHYVPQPADFPGSKAELAYLKTVWMRID